MNFFQIYYFSFYFWLAYYLMGFSIFFEFAKVVISNNPKFLLESSEEEKSWFSVIIFILLLTLWPLVAMVVALIIKVRIISEEIKEEQRLKEIEREEKIKEIFGSIYEYEDFIEKTKEIKNMPETNFETKYKKLMAQEEFLESLKKKHGKDFFERIEKDLR